MSRRGSTSTANRVTRAGAVITATPCTFAVWYKAITLPSTDANDGHAILVITDTATDDNFFGLFGRVADDLFRFSAQATGLPLRSAVSTTAITVGQWFHVCGVSASTTDRRIYIDGVDEGQNTVSRTPAGLDQTNMFVTRISSGFFSPANADLAEVGIWNAALTAGEVSALASGISPQRVRSTSLRAYWDLPASNAGNVIDYSGNGNTLFETGTIGIADHAPVGPMFGFDLGWQGWVIGAEAIVFAAWVHPALCRAIRAFPHRMRLVRARPGHIQDADPNLDTG